jgi:hypothetical protein
MFMAGVLECVDDVAAEIGGDAVEGGDAGSGNAQRAGHMMHGRRHPTGD